MAALFSLLVALTGFTWLFAVEELDEIVNR